MVDMINKRAYFEMMEDYCKEHIGDPTLVLSQMNWFAEEELRKYSHELIFKSINTSELGAKIKEFAHKDHQWCSEFINQYRQ